MTAAQYHSITEQFIEWYHRDQKKRTMSWVPRGDTRRGQSLPVMKDEVVEAMLAKLGCPVIEKMYEEYCSFTDTIYIHYCSDYIDIPKCSATVGWYKDLFQLYGEAIGHPKRLNYRTMYEGEYSVIGILFSAMMLVRTGMAKKFLPYWGTSWIRDKEQIEKGTPRAEKAAIEAVEYVWNLH